MTKEQIGLHIVPILLKSSKDPVPNVRFCVAKLFKKIITKIDSQSLMTKIKPRLAEMTTDSDKEVQFFAKGALAVC